MNVDASEAARALEDIEKTGDRVLKLRMYREAAPHFIMWGLVWLFGNGSLALLPHTIAQWILMGLVVAAIIGGAVMGSLQDRGVKGETASQVKARKRMGSQITMVILTIFAVVLGAAIVFWPFEYQQMNVFISLVAGLAYVGVGAFAGWRWIAVGGVVVALVLGGYLLLSVQHYYLWMAVVAGGALILGGLWLRKA